MCVMCFDYGSFSRRPACYNTDTKLDPARCLQERGFSRRPACYNTDTGNALNLRDDPVAFQSKTCML